MFGKWWHILISAFIGLFLFGCNLGGGMNRQMDAAGNVAQILADKIQEEGVLDKWLANVDGHLQDPGVESYVSITIAGGVHAKGVNGNVTAQGGGDSTKLPTGTLGTLIDLIKDPRTPEAERQKYIELLLWNRHPTG